MQEGAETGEEGDDDVRTIDKWRDFAFRNMGQNVDTLVERFVSEEVCAALATVARQHRGSHDASSA